MTLLDYFKTYFNITTQKYYVATNTQLQAFITAHAADIIANDTEFAAVTTINFTAHNNTFNNSASSVHKWVTPDALYFNAIIYIALIMYRNDGVTEDILMRVHDASIKSSTNYPGIDFGIIVPPAEA